MNRIMYFARSPVFWFCILDDMMVQRKVRGFTLIELLVALLIMALLAIAGYRGLDAVLQARLVVAHETRKWQHLMYCFSRMQLDLAQPLPRPVRDQNGNVQPEFLGLAAVAGNNEARLSFTRAGDGEGGPSRMVPQRIGYLLQGDTLMLLRWPALDQPPGARPERYPLLKGVRKFDLRYLGATGNWYESWPPAGQNGGGPAAGGRL